MAGRFFMVTASGRGGLQEPGLPRLAFMFAQAPAAGFSSGTHAGGRVTVGYANLARRVGAARRP
jgi:hypothetical protein